MINRFSRLNSTFSDVEDELKAKRAEREELEDLGLELEFMEDEDVLYVQHNSCLYSYKIGDAYMSMPQSEAVEQLEQDTRRTSAELARLEDQMSECEKGMSELKVKLYARFGSNISMSVGMWKTNETSSARQVRRPVDRQPEHIDARFRRPFSCTQTTPRRVQYPCFV